MIVFGSLLDFHSNGKVFEIAIQLGAVLAVVFEYRQRFGYVVKNFGRDAKVNRFVTNLAVAFVPAAIVGLLFSKQIENRALNPISVATALVLGGFVILWVERRQSTRKPKVTDVDDMKVRDALVVDWRRFWRWCPAPRAGQHHYGRHALGVGIAKWPRNFRFSSPCR